MCKCIVGKETVQLRTWTVTTTHLRTWSATSMKVASARSCWTTNSLRSCKSTLSSSRVTDSTLQTQCRRRRRWRHRRCPCRKLEVCTRLHSRIYYIHVNLCMRDGFTTTLSPNTCISIIFSQPSYLVMKLAKVVASGRIFSSCSSQSVPSSVMYSTIQRQ